MVSAIAAYLILTGTHMSWGVLTIWTFFLAALGVCMAIPMKRQMINIEQLKFPSGIACAETLRSLHSHGAEAIRKAKALGQNSQPNSLPRLDLWLLYEEPNLQLRH